MRVLIAILFVLAAAGCSRGPATDALKGGVGERIAQALPPGTVTLASFARRGSQSDSKAPAGETRRIVYFDAELKLERDFDFGAWDAPGVAGLVSALGTGPRGITGITSGGNKAGDTLRAHGTAVYRREASGWVAVASGGFRPTVAPAYATSSKQGAAAILEAMRKVMESVQRDASPEQVALIEDELAAAHATIQARLARIREGYAIAAGPEHGQYLRFAQAFPDGKTARAIPLVTRGGDENLRLLRGGKVTLALAQGDAALAAYEGKGSFAGDGPYVSLRAVGSLYPEPVHVLVRADGPLETMADLKDKRIGIGEQGSASRGTALRVLQAHGLGPKDFTALELGLRDALVALQRGEADAVIQVIGVPADSVRDAIAVIPLRLLPLSERAVVTLVKARAGLFAHSISRGTYANQKQDVRTVATAALLLVSPELTDSEVGAVTRFVYEKGRDLVARGSSQGTQVSVATARHGLSIPLHPAAAKALEAIK